MLLFADILLLAVTLVSPTPGETVPVLREPQRAYLDKAQAERFTLMTSAEDRRRLESCGATQLPVRLTWRGDSPAYRLEITRQGGVASVFSVSNRTEAYITNLELGARYNWSVAPIGTAEDAASGAFETEAMPPRLLRAGGVSNFRDLGGWRGLGGRVVRQGRILRSAGLRGSASQKGSALFGGALIAGGNRITSAGISTLRDEFGIRTDIELRNNQESAFLTSSILGPEVRWVHVPFAAYDFIDNPVRGREPFAELFQTFLDEANYPILMHCSGGRDRTGTLAFLLNGLLGVGDDDLCRDWEATVFSEASINFGPDRIERLISYLKTLGGKTLAERCERYALGCGILPEDIEKFRRLMLEETP